MRHQTIKDLDTIALTRDISEHGLTKGDIGTVVAVYENGKGFEVEFMTLGGKTLAVLTLDRDDVRPLTDSEIAHARQVA